ncbi:nitroreductase family protein [Agaribacterium haliotis]|uniref:nitroreductase family protein n=1 Tax=Agaribacterium haliotis TaxID=2013869 RepID=UPI000BB561AE|nr:nitroreductase [Agaribacterium haliotis]
MSSNTLLNALHSRRSVLANNMCEPGPNDEELHDILKAAHRVPDHGKIGPWRFFVFRGDKRAEFGAILKLRFAQKENSASAKLLEFEAQRFMRAPIVIGVSSNPNLQHKVPVWEQELSAGAACQNILLAAQALGFKAQWVTEWYAFDEDINKVLELNENERMAGFIYIGSTKEEPSERVRPDLNERIIHWGE